MKALKMIWAALAALGAAFVEGAKVAGMTEAGVGFLPDHEVGEFFKEVK